MKGIKIALIAVLTTLAVGLAVVLANVLSGGLSFGGLFWGENWSLFSGNGIMPGSGSIFGNATLQAETELPGDNIGEISVDFNKTGCDIIFLPSEDDSIRVKEYYNKEIDENKRALITMADSSLVIRQRLNTGLSTSIRNVSGYVEIYIPGTVYSALKKLNVSTTSGDVSVPKWDGVDEMNMDKLEISTTSGDIDVEWLRAREARMNSTSGDLTMGVMSGNLSMNATSGDMEVSEIEGRLVMSGTSGSQTAGKVMGDLDMGSTSGDLKADFVSGNVKMNTVSGWQRVGGMAGSGSFGSTSGDITVTVEEMKGSLDFGSTSGSLDIMVPSGSSFTVDIDTTSGEVSTSFDDVLSFNKRRTSAAGNVGHDLSYSIEAHTTSGDVKIRER